MKWLHSILLALGVIFLGWLISRLGLRELTQQLRALGWAFVPLVLLEGVAYLCHAVGWRFCLMRPHRQLPLMRVFRIRMAGFALNYLTPTASLGGELAKVALLAPGRHTSEALSAVLIGKLCFGSAQLVFVLIGSLVLLWRVPLPRALWLALLVSSALMAGALGAFLLVQKHGKVGALVRWLAGREIGGPGIKRFAGKMSHVDEVVKLFYRERPWDLPRAIGWHLLGYSMGIVQAWLFFSIVVPETPLAIGAAVFFVGMWFDLILSAAPTNIGVQEWSRVTTIKAVGGTAIAGLTYGVATRLAQLFWAGFGLLNYALLAAKPVVSVDEQCCVREEQVAG